MKKTILLLLLILSSISLQAQFTLTNYESGQQINEGDVVVVDTSGITTHVIATNTSNSDIYLSLQVMNIINTNGTEMTYCFGVAGGGSCYPQMNNGDIKNSGNPLAPGASTGNADIDFTHTDNQTNFPNYPKDYVIKLYATATNGGAQIGNAITFTYRYDPTYNAIDNVFSKDEFNVISLSGKLQITNKQNLKISLFDLTGKKVKSLELSAGVNEINTSNFTKGLYIINASNRQKQITRKIIIK